MFKNTRLGHWHLLHRCYLGILGLSFSTHSRILFSSEYFHYKIFIHEKCLEKLNDKFQENLSRPGVPGRGPAVEKHCLRVELHHVTITHTWLRDRSRGLAGRRVRLCECVSMYKKDSYCSLSLSAMYIMRYNSQKHLTDQLHLNREISNAIHRVSVIVTTE